MRRIFRSLLSVASLIAMMLFSGPLLAAPTVAPSAAPDPSSNIPIAVDDHCLSQDPADSTKTRDANVAEVTSPVDGNKVPLYPKKAGCQRFVVDFKLPAPSSGSSTNYMSLLYVDPVAPDTKAACNAKSVSMAVFVKKPGESKFTYQSGGWWKGDWNGSTGACSRAWQSRSGDFGGFKRPDSGTTVIRVITWGKLGTDYVPVKMTFG
jgi:hypothetical protein